MEQDKVKNIGDLIERATNFNSKIDIYKEELKKNGYSILECMDKSSLLIKHENAEILLLNYGQFYIEPTIVYYLEEEQHNKVMDLSLILIKNLKDLIF
jgi:hypothetical protein